MDRFRSDSGSESVGLLSEAKVGDQGLITYVGHPSDVSQGELERRLLEFGFVEGAHIQVLYQGLFGDPIAVRVDDICIALRRQEARLVAVRFEPEAAPQ